MKIKVKISQMAKLFHCSIFLLCSVSFAVAQINLPVGVPLPPGAPGSSGAVEAPSAIAPAGPPAGPPGGGTGQVSLPSAGHSRTRPHVPSSPVDLGNPSVSVCSGFGWTIYNGNCYKVVEGLMGWNQAVAACKAEDPKAQLVSIESEAENRFIGRMITRPLARSQKTYHLATTLFNTFWIGLRRVLVGNRYQSTWTNGSAATFGNVPEITTAVMSTGGRNKYPWGGGQPSGTNKFTDPTGAKEECVHMFSADGQWNDAGCEIQMTGAICQKSAQF
ncbi:hypothetical protein niasHT_020993 [Heterodera trifolii]|uniref:C-type lectin domain-containing protein n=1 Tax=Heterodera trifolii TaxID=157864 RepID=A0ABD2KD87_9BILA